jgi:hypothetical protein
MFLVYMFLHVRSYITLDALGYRRVSFSHPEVTDATEVDCYEAYEDYASDPMPDFRDRVRCRRVCAIRLLYPEAFPVPFPDRPCRRDGYVARRPQALRPSLGQGSPPDQQ